MTTHSLIIHAFLAVLFLPAGLELVIAPSGGGHPLFRVPIEAGEQFTLRYIHSVDLAPVWEIHSVDEEGNIYIEEERFRVFGAGMGHWEGHGNFTKRDTYLAIENIHRNIGSFVLRVGGEAADHTILLEDRSLYLSRSAAGLAVLVSAEQVKTVDRLRRYFKGESRADG